MGCPRQTIVSPARRRHGGLSLLLFSPFFDVSLLLPLLLLLLLLPSSLLLLSLRVNNLFLTGSFSHRNVVIESRNGSFDLLALFFSNFLITLPMNPIDSTLPIPKSPLLSLVLSLSLDDGELYQNMNIRVPSEPRHALRKRNHPQLQKNTVLLLTHEFEKLTIH